MAMNLVELKALYPTDPMRQRLISKFLDEGDSLILPELFFVDAVDALGYNFVQQEGLGDVSGRSINGSYTDTDSNESPKRETLSLFGGSIKTDQVIIDAKGDVARLNRIDKRMKAAARYFDALFVNGNSQADPKQFNGLKKRAVDRANTIWMATNGGPLTLDALNQAQDEVAGENSKKVIVCSRWMRRKITALVQSAAKGQGIQEAQIQVPTYNGSRILPLTEDNLYNPIFPFTETRGSSNVTSSLYVVRFGQSADEEFVQGIKGPSFMKLRTPVNMGEYVRDVIDNVLGLVDFGPYAFRRVGGITQA